MTHWILRAMDRVGDAGDSIVTHAIAFAIGVVITLAVTSAL